MRIQIPAAAATRCRALAIASVLALTASLACAAEPPGATRFRFDTTPGHLAKTVRPVTYRLTLELDPERSGFDARASIDLRVTQTQAAIELHAFELEARQARLIRTGQAARTLRVVTLPATQTWRLEPADGRPIEPGRYQLDIDYSGKVQVAGEGLYVAPYSTDGRQQRMLATQLEAIHARRVLPCFDEPAFRAVFELSVRAPRSYDVVSNMPRRSRQLVGDQALHRFAATPPMPSYLFSVAVGNFDVLSSRSGRLSLRILVAPGKREHAREALRATRDVLPYYARYFGQAYALPKLDQLAVPSVRWGAMEDWGLISYAENNLLVDPARSDEATRRGVYQTVAHEIAHQWFGNLVTAASWEEIWLNEAFATWMENKVSDHFNPAWKMQQQLRPGLDRAMALDAGAATRAIRSGPVRETAVSDVFDSITYAKGGAVLSMLELWMGSSDFRRGLAGYMKERRLSNATAADLWHHIGQASARDVTGMATSWTDQPGFPLVEAQGRCVAGQASLTLGQRRYSNTPDATSEQLWQIPVQVRHAGAVRTVVLRSRQTSVELGACSDQPTIVNAGGQGFYRVAYEPTAWQALVRGYAALPEADRVTLLSDSFALLQAGRQTTSAHLALLETLPQVEMASQPILWSIARRQFEYLDAVTAGLPAQQQLRALGRRLAEPVLDRLGWDERAGEDADRGELRGTLIKLLARFDHEPTIARATSAFDADQAGTRALPAALRDAVIRATGTHADRRHHDQLLARLKASNSEEERWSLVHALCSGRDAERSTELLALSLGNELPANIASEIPSLIARNSPFGAAAYAHSVANWARLAALAGTWGRADLLPGASAGHHDAAHAQVLIDDQRHLAGADGDRPAMQQVEEIRLRSAVRARAAADFTQLPVAATQP